MAQVLTNTGRGQMIVQIAAHLTAPYMGWGTGAGTSGVTDTTLFTEVAAERALSTQTVVQTTLPNDTLNNVCVLTSVSGGTYTNAGLFDASSGPNLWSKTDFAGVVLGAGDKIQFTNKIQQT